MHWETKNLCDSLLRYLLYYGGLELTSQGLQAVPALVKYIRLPCLMENYILNDLTL